VVKSSSLIFQGDDMVRKLKEAPEEVELAEQVSTIAKDEAENLAINQVGSRCGGVLRAAREKQGLSVQEIASRLRLSPKQIEAIEADNFSVLPEPTIVRGFIRNYAKQLKIEGEPILAGYSAIVPSSTPHELVVKPSSNMTVSGYEKSKAGRYIIAALALLLGLAAWLFYQHYIAKPSPTKPSASISANETASDTVNQAEAAPENVATPTDLPQPALPAAERQEVVPDNATPVTLPPANAVPALPVTPANQAVTAVSTTATVTTPAATPLTTPVPANAPAGAAPVNAKPATATPTLQTSNSLGASLDAPPALPANGKKRLEINASQETWVNITDASGREIYSKIIFAGSRETIEATPPLNITVGNAGGTTLAVNGKPMDLAPHTRVNVAHIKVER
jgi:cytoskeleton protein RodZ